MQESQTIASDTRNEAQFQKDRSYISLLVRVSLVLVTLIVGVHLLIVYRQ
jgi:hypothetical protein